MISFSLFSKESSEREKLQNGCSERSVGNSHTRLLQDRSDKRSGIKAVFRNELTVKNADQGVDKLPVLKIQAGNSCRKISPCCAVTQEQVISGTVFPLFFQIFPNESRKFRIVCDNTSFFIVFSQHVFL